MTQQQQTLLDKKISGLTWRLAIAGLASVITLEATILAYYYKMDTRISILELQMNNNTKDIDRMKDVLFPGDKISSK